MKKNLAMLVFFFAVWTVSAQQYMLPIGSNVNNRPARVQLAIGGYGVWAEDDFAYTPAMGELESLIRNRLWKLAEGFVPAVGYEDCGVSVHVTPGPFGGSYFQLQKLGNRWVVPTEALEVKLEYGRSVGWQLQGVTAVSMRLYKEGTLVKYYSTKEGVGGDSPCEITSAQSVFTMGWATINAKYGLPWLKDDSWDSGDVTIEAFDGFATFNVLDGAFIEGSDPPPVFLAQLVAPLVPPRITSIQRVGEFTEISVSVADGVRIVLEFSEDFKSWVTVDPPTVSKMSVGSRTLSHVPPTGVQCGFYRVKVPKPPALK